MIHVYTGDGKGKTTAAMGLALRAAGTGKAVIIVQFLKGRDSGEIVSLKKIDGITVFRNSRDWGFFYKMTEDARSNVILENNGNLEKALEMKSELLVLDEVISAYNMGAVDKGKVDTLINAPPCELVLTGRDPPDHFIASADYVSEIRKVKHPFDRGIKAREGVEF
jgi:cob(I)alamin adenosyltransferase